ncbi:MAG TPA: diaminopropionate ammonia-lyase [Vicinamibacterales bacterium]
MSIEWWSRTDSRPVATPFFSDEELADVRRFYGPGTRLGARPTPLHRLPGLATRIGVGELLVKDESSRFGLPAFKIVGAQYAIARLLAQPRQGRVTDLACATAGNHGRAVARAARELGLAAHVYVPVGTSQLAVDALRSEGAHVVVTSDDYDKTVRLMADDAGDSGWTIVSDTAWDGYEQIPRWTMAGYTRILEEAAQQWGDAPPDLVIVQAGVGSLAGAVAGWLVAAFGQSRPRLVVAEPAGAACVTRSLRAGELVTLPSCAPTTMACLRCGEVSPLAWRALAPVVDAAIGITDDQAVEAREWLAHPSLDDPAILAGASGAAGLGALITLLRAAELSGLRDALRLSRSTRAMAIVTEGSGLFSTD